MDSNIKAPEVPERLRFAIDNVIRESTSAGFAITGIAFADNPLSIVMLRNTKEDPLSTFKAVVDMLETRRRVGAPVVEEQIGRIN